jgi:hypothetical protein
MSFMIDTALKPSAVMDGATKMAAIIFGGASLIGYSPPPSRMSSVIE